MRRAAALATLLAALLLPGVARAQATPTATQISAAKAYLKAREGRRAFAVIDSDGRLDGINVHARFVTASVVKAMLLVEYLRKVDHSDRALTARERRRLGAMIRVSDNDAATAVYRRVRDGGLRRAAEIAGMDDFVIGPNSIRSCRCSARGWARAQISAADQARLFYGLDSVLPERFRAYAKGLLETVVTEQSWGIPAVARPAGWRVFFKIGVRSTGRGRLIHQAARLERGFSAIAIAVLTDGNPAYGYGKRSVSGAGWLLAGAPAAR